MATVILSLIIMGTIMTAMAVGVIFGREPIKGSCGGLNAVGLDGECEICGGDTNKCDSDKRKQAALNASIAYDATKDDRP